MDKLLTEQSKRLEVAMFENCLSDDPLKIYQGTKFTTTEPEQIVQNIINALGEFTAGVNNEIYEHFVSKEKTGREWNFWEFLVACGFC